MNPRGKGQPLVATPSLVLAIACLVSFVGGFLIVNVAPAIDVAEGRLGLSAIQTGYILSAMFLSHTFFLLFAGEFIDRLGVWKVLLGALSVAVLASILQAVATGFLIMVLARLLMGVESGLGYVSGLQLVGMYTGGGASQSFRQGLYGGMNHLGVVTAMLLVPTGVSSLGWPGFYLAVALIVLLCAILVSWSLRPLANVPPLAKVPWHEVLGDRRMWWFCLAHAISLGLYMSVVPWLVKVLLGQFGASASLAAIASAAITASAFPARVVGGYLAVRWGDRPVIYGSSLGMVLVLLFLALPLSLPVAILTLALVAMLGNFPFGAIFGLVTKTFSGGPAGRRLGTILAPGSVLMFVLPASYGYALELSGSYSTGFWLWTGVGALLFLLLLVNGHWIKAPVRQAAPTSG